MNAAAAGEIRRVRCLDVNEAITSWSHTAAIKTQLIAGATYQPQDFPRFNVMVVSGSEVVSVIGGFRLLVRITEGEARGCYSQCGNSGFGSVSTLWTNKQPDYSDSSFTSFGPPDGAPHDINMAMNVRGDQLSSLLGHSMATVEKRQRSLLQAQGSYSTIYWP